jgi:hypothetical protein
MASSQTPREPTPVSDPVVDAYKKDIDRTLLRENLKLTPEQRLQQLMKLQAFADELQAAGRRARRR